MLRTEVPPRRRARNGANLLVSLRSPLPMLVAGLGVTLLVIALVALPPRAANAPVEATQTANLSEEEALTLVAREMRSGEVASQIRAQGKTRFEDGTWHVTLGDAQFHFSQRNRVVVADNPQAIALEFREPTR